MRELILKVCLVRLRMVARHVLVMGAALYSMAYALDVAAAPAQVQQHWITYKSDDAKLIFEYPSGIFTEQQGDPTDAVEKRTPDRAGRTFTSADGKAALQIGTVPNLDNSTVDELRKRAIAASYSEAKLDYNRSSSTWYALSGRRGPETFYERVHFSCNNRRLDIWAMTYPTSESDFYDDIVEEMSRRFRPILANVKCP